MPTLVLTTPSNPGIATWTDASLLPVGGCTTIPAGGTISGTYDCLLCEGAVSMTGDVTVRGNMIVLGDLTNDAGWDLTVEGDVHGAGFDFTRAITTLPQGNFTVGGDLSFTTILMPQYTNTTSALTVDGDLLGRGIPASSLDSSVNLAGAVGIDGGDVIVSGSVVTGQIVASGGACDPGVTNGGNGGDVLIKGTCSLDAAFALSGILTNGGGAPGGGAATNVDGGNAGFIAVLGALTANSFAVVDATGPSAVNGNGGNGSAVTLLGANFLFGGVFTFGGDCDSNNDLHIAGNGGQITTGGASTILLGLTSRGGDRIGTLSAITSATPGAAGGDIQCFAALVTNDIIARGGDVSTTVGANRNGGSGGDLNINAELYCGNIELRGGNCTFGSGGDSGSFTCLTSAFTGNCDFSGGTSTDIGSGGSAGSANFQNLSCGAFSASGGSAVTGNGGGPGGAYSGGTLKASTVTLNGGASLQNSASQGGVISVNRLLLVISGANSLSGGFCAATDDTQSAGIGGTITVSVLECQGSLALNGGARSGATTSVNLTTISPQGGTITANVSARFYDFVSLDGGAVSTAVQNCSAGAGGTLQVYGPLTFTTISARGGSGVGASDGGNGGYLQTLGLANGYSIFLNGGNATNPLSCGRGGYVYCTAGINAEELDCLDGTGGTAPVSPVINELGGSCKVATWRQTDRASSEIRSNGLNPASLQIGAMPNKQTLDDSSGVTGNISAALDSSMFINNTSPNRWYTITGVAT